MTKFLTTAALATVLISDAAHAGTVEHEMAVKLTLHQISCGQQTDAVARARDMFVAKVGGVKAITSDVFSLQHKIQMVGTIKEWCGVMDEQFDAVAKMVILRAK